MRKILFIALIALFLTGNASQAAQTTSSMTVTVTVSGSFYLIVNTDSFDFARLLPGQTGEITRADGVAVTGSSAGGDPWYLKVNTVRALTSGSDYIPNENFTWNGTTEGKGGWYGSGDRSLANSNGTAYISTRQESESGEKVVNKFKFKLRVPEDTPPGSYTTTVMFTMTE